MAPRSRLPMIRRRCPMSVIQRVLMMPAHNAKAATLDAHRLSVEQAVCYMRAHYSRRLCLGELARAARMSKFHFIRAFDVTTGTTPHHFLSCLRIQRAKELLLATNDSVTDICMEVGYESLGSFSSVFARLVGVSPRRFRTMARQLSVPDLRARVDALASRQVVHSEATLAGYVESPFKAAGTVFVGMFQEGVPQARPATGTVCATTGKYTLNRVPLARAHLLAVMVRDIDGALSCPALESVLVASHRLNVCQLEGFRLPTLILRRPRVTDPPIVAALTVLLEDNEPDTRAAGVTRRAI